MLDEQIVELNISGLMDKEQVLSYLADKMYDCGVVKLSYKDAILKRELQFPTALQFNGYGIAMPHTDIEHVNKAQISVMTLAEPVVFYQMATANVEVPVRVIIMLALKEAHSQLEMLQKIMVLLQDEKSMARIQSLDNSEESKQELLSILKNNGIQ